VCVCVCVRYGLVNRERKKERQREIAASKMTTIVCSDCNQAKGKEDFSKSQLKKKTTEKRRCKSCAEKVDGNNNSNSNGNSNSNNNPCYHGCLTKKEFHCVEYYRFLEDWSQLDLIDDHETYNKECGEFYEKNLRIMRDPFGRFVIARIADDYLKGEVGDICHRLSLLLSIRYVYFQGLEGKDVVSLESEYTKSYKKYVRDIQTERGRINCMAREIPCDCMEKKRIEAQSMERVAICYCCRKEFPKENMLRCLGCNYDQYCSQKCSIKHWPEHKEWCKRNSVSSAPTPASASIPSSFGEPSDDDAEE